MKTFRIKNELASSLAGLPGVFVRFSSTGYSQVRLIDSGLPKSANASLVNDFLQQMQYDKANPEKVQLLIEYLQCAEKKDKNKKIDGDVVNALKQMLYGMLLVLSSAGGVLLTLLLTGLFPVYASWIALLLIPCVALAIYGGLNTLVGVIKLGFGVVACCVAKNNIESFSFLEQELKNNVVNSDLPSYEDTQKNYYQPIFLENECPPSYQQATELPTRMVTPPVVSVVASTANFFQTGQSEFSHREVGDHSVRMNR